MNSTDGSGGRGDRAGGPTPQGPPTERSVLTAGVLLAVGAAAVSLVAGLGTYLYIRFTQHRKKPPEE